MVLALLLVSIGTGGARPSASTNISLPPPPVPPNAALADVPQQGVTEHPAAVRHRTTLKAIKIQWVGTPGLESELRAALPLKVGDSISSNSLPNPGTTLSWELSQAVKSLYATGRYENIRMVTEDRKKGADGETATLRIVVMSAPRLTAVHFKGFKGADAILLAEAGLPKAKQGEKAPRILEWQVAKGARALERFLAGAGHSKVTVTYKLEVQEKTRLTQVTYSTEAR